MQEVPSVRLAIHDSFWSPRRETNAARAIFHQWGQLETSGCIDNFRILAGEKDGWREGWFFADSDAYKWLDAAARISLRSPDPALSANMDELLGLIARTQTPDGYLFTYNQIHYPGVRWVNLLVEHELYCHGHLIEACLAHYEATQRKESLAIARTAADLLGRDFLGKGPAFTPGHEEVEIALLCLHQATGESSYLRLARQFLDQRGAGRRLAFVFSLLRQVLSSASRGREVDRRRMAYFAARGQDPARRVPPGNAARRPPGSTLRWAASAFSGEYFQQHAPLRRQTVPVGHAVRFGYLQTAAAMLERVAPGSGLRPALEKSWERMVDRRMYVTGGLGSQPGLEGFGRDYDLDPEYAYAETCAALASIFWNREMALLTGDAKYADLAEWQLYNAASVGMGFDGTTYLYNNPLASRGGILRRPWFEVPCCPSNLSRTWADLDRYILSARGREVWIHQYIGCEGSFEAKGSWGVTIQSGLPFAGAASVRFEPPAPAELSLHLRVPSWSRVTRFAVNGEAVDVPSAPAFPPTAQGYDPRLARYLTVRRLWHPGDTVTAEFGLAVTLRRAHPRVKNHRGKTAITRGPLVYCLESVDNPGIDLFTCQLNPATLRPEPAPDLLGGITVLRGRTVAGQVLCFIPYALWANRGESQMNVWVRAR